VLCRRCPRGCGANGPGQRRRQCRASAVPVPCQCQHRASAGTDTDATRRATSRRCVCCSVSKPRSVRQEHRPCDRVSARNLSHAIWCHSAMAALLALAALCDMPRCTMNVLSHSPIRKVSPAFSSLPRREPVGGRCFARYPPKAIHFCHRGGTGTSAEGPWEAEGHCV
jgi:hypothetical protein